MSFLVTCPNKTDSPGQVAVGGLLAAGVAVEYGEWAWRAIFFSIQMYLIFEAGRRGPNVQGLKRFEAMDAPPMGGGGC
jgi:hypothetical protein